MSAWLPVILIFYTMSIWIWGYAIGFSEGKK